MAKDSTAQSFKKKQTKDFPMGRGAGVNKNYEVFLVDRVKLREPSKQ